MCTTHPFLFMLEGKVLSDLPPLSDPISRKSYEQEPESQYHFESSLSIMTTEMMHHHHETQCQDPLKAKERVSKLQQHATPWQWSIMLIARRIRFYFYVSIINCRSRSWSPSLRRRVCCQSSINLRQPILFAIAHTQSPNYASPFMYIKTPPTIRVGKNVGYIDAWK